MFYGAYNEVRFSHVFYYLTADLEAIEESRNRKLRIAIFFPQKLDSNTALITCQGKVRQRRVDSQSFKRMKAVPP